MLSMFRVLVLVACLMQTPELLNEENVLAHRTITNALTKVFTNHINRSSAQRENLLESCCVIQEFVDDMSDISLYVSEIVFGCVGNMLKLVWALWTCLRYVWSCCGFWLARQHGVGDE